MRFPDGVRSRLAKLAGIVGVVSLIAYASITYVTQASIARGFAALGAVALLSYAWLDRAPIAEGMARRSVRRGLLSAASVVLCAVLGILAVALSVRYDHRWDLTGEHRVSLADGTRRRLRGLDREVELYAFFRSGSAEERRFRSLAEAISDETERVRIEFVDPVRRPLIAERFRVTSEYGTVILARGSERQRLDSRFDERAFDAALARLVSGRDRRVCWSTGHDEADPDDDTSAEGLGVAVLHLEELDYAIEEIGLFRGEVPDTCEGVVVARPTRDFLPMEREALATYVAGGGGVFLMLEPRTVPELAEEMGRYGVEVGEDVVLDASPANRLGGVDDPSVLVLSERSMTFHPITSSLGAVVVLGFARSVGMGAEREELSVEELLFAGPGSWGETTFDGGDAFDVPQPDPGLDSVGDVPLMAAVEVLDPEVLEVPPKVGLRAGGRVVVVGDASFASNEMLALGSNEDLFRSALAWALGSDEVLGEAPAGEEQVMVVSGLQEAMLWLVSVFLFPVAALGIGAMTWWRRRSL